MDMSPFVVPKSDQLNCDDLLAGPRTIRIAKVAGTGSAEQPVAVHYDGDDGKPYKPCKSMRRVMIAAWGVDASKYVGRSMTLYRDPRVTYGGMETGGIRISHMSHIDAPLAMALTVTKAKRASYRVHPLSPEPPAPALDTALLDQKYREFADKHDKEGVKAWLNALAAPAQNYVRQIMANDKKENAYE